MKRQIWFKVGVAIVAILLLSGLPLVTACAGAEPGTAPEPGTDWDKIVEAAKEEGEVTYYTINASQEVRAAQESEFESVYGIKVNYQSG